MKQRLLCSFLFLATFVWGFAQIPDGYYNPAVGKSGEELRTALHEIINAHTVISYGGSRAISPSRRSDRDNLAANHHMA